MDRYTDSQHRTWARLHDLLAPRVARHACRAHREGLARLDLPRDRIPTLAELNARLSAATGWTLVRAADERPTAAAYYAMLADRRFLVSDVVRPESDLEFAPEPDLFHDLFGHAPLLMDPAVSDLEALIARTFLRVGDEDRERVKRLAWASTEFGLVREDGAPRLLGAGLLSSAGEIDRVVAGEVAVREFACEDVLAGERTVWDYNPVLFVADGVSGYRARLEACFDAMADRG